MPPYDDVFSAVADEAKSEHQAPPSSRATVRMVEYSSDDKPDIWFKAEVVSVSATAEEIEALLDKFGLPKAIVVNCLAQQAEIRDRMLKDAQANQDDAQRT